MSDTSATSVRLLMRGPSGPARSPDIHRDTPMATSATNASAQPVAPQIATVEVSGAQPTIVGLLTKTTIGRFEEAEARSAIEFMMGAEGASSAAIDQSMIAVSMSANRPAVITIVCLDTATTASIMPTSVGNSREMRINLPPSAVRFTARLAFANTDEADRLLMEGGAGGGLSLSSLFPLVLYQDEIGTLPMAGPEVPKALEHYRSVTEASARIAYDEPRITIPDPPTWECRMKGGRSKSALAYTLWAPTRLTPVPSLYFGYGTQTGRMDVAAAKRARVEGVKISLDMRLLTIGDPRAPRAFRVLGYHVVRGAFVKVSRKPGVGATPPVPHPGGAAPTGPVAPLHEARPKREQRSTETQALRREGPGDREHWLKRTKECAEKCAAYSTMPPHLLHPMSYALHPASSGPRSSPTSYILHPTSYLPHLMRPAVCM